MVDELTTSTPDTEESASVYEEAAPTPKRKFLFFGLVIVILIVIIGGGIVLYLRGDIRLPGAPTPLPKVMEKVKNGKAKCTDAKDKEKCLAELLLDEAVAGKQAAACGKIEKENLRDGCYDAIARETRDEKICAGISRAAAAHDCIGAILFVKSKTNSDTAICETIVSAKWQDTCYSRIFIEKGSLAYCETAGEKRDLCVSIVAYREATSVGDPALCSPIGDGDLKASCEEDAAAQAVNKDTDGDGLTDGEEVGIYKTDPRNPDTDGDGFKDGDEVKAGYNPKGPGRLQ